MSDPLGTSTAAPPPGSIQYCLAEFLGWLTDVTSLPTAVGAEGPSDSTGRLLVRPVALLSDSTGPGLPLALRVRFAVLVDLPVPAGAEILDRLLAAALSDRRYRPVFETPSATVVETPGERWPPLLVDVAVRVSAPDATVPRVREALRVVITEPQLLRGRLLGPDDVPLSGMKVTARGTGTTATTDRSGWFTLPAQPADRTVGLDVTGHGQHLRVDVTPSTTDPVVIRCPIEET